MKEIKDPHNFFSVDNKCPSPCVNVRTPASNIETISQALLLDEKIRNEIPVGVNVEVIAGANYDLQSLKIDEAIPSTRAFIVYKYKNPKT